MKNPLIKRLPRELKQDFAKYLVIFAFMVMLVSAVSGFLVADYSVKAAYDEGFTKYNLEWGHITFDQAPPQDMLDEIAKENEITFFDMSYFEEEEKASGANVRVYANRELVNTACLMTEDSRLPKADDEIALDRMFATNNDMQIGDVITLKDTNLKIVGLIALPDYSCLFENNNDMMFDSINFGVGVMTEAGMDALGSNHFYDSYAWRYEVEPEDDAAEKQLSDDILETVGDHLEAYDTKLIEDQVEEQLEKLQEDYMAALMAGEAVLELDMEDVMNHPEDYVEIDESGIIGVSGFIPRYANKAINFTGEDMGSDKAMIQLFDYIIVAVLAFIFAVTTSNTIAQEAAVIGTLRASGYTKGELIRHYMILPVFVTLVAAAIGNLLGYTVMKDVFVGVYYGSYSLCTYETLWSADALIDTTVVPVIIMFAINFVVIVRKLRLSPLKFLRRDLSTKQKKKSFRLNTKIPFMIRFRLRIIFQNIPNYLTLFLGIVIGGMLVVFGLMFGPLLDDYAKLVEGSMIANHQYVVKNQVKTKAQGAEKYNLTSLNYQKEGYMEEEIMVYGIVDDSKYIDLSIEPSMKNASDVAVVYVSNGMMDKYNLKEGMQITLEDPYSDATYAFEVKGQYTYDAAMSIFMNRKDYNKMFDKSNSFFTGYFSDVEIKDIDEKYILADLTVDDMMKVANQLKVSMGKMMAIFQYFGVVMFILVMYILAKQIIEKNTQSISMVKILGFYNGEIGGLYIVATSIVVVLSLVGAVPLISLFLRWCFTEYLYTMVTGYFPYIVSSSVYVKMIVIGILSYGIVALLQMIKIGKISKADALKNVE